MQNTDLIQIINEEQINWVKSLRKEKFETFANTPMPSWKRLKFKDYALPYFKKYSKDYIKNENSNNSIIKSIINGMDDEKYKKFAHVDAPFGVDKKFVALGEAFYNSGVLVDVPENTHCDKPIMVEYKLDKENPMVIDHNIIVAEKNSSATIIFDYSTIEDVNGFHNGVTKVFAKDGAIINIIKIQRMNNASHDFDSNIAFAGCQAKVNWVTVELGGEIGVSSYITNLEEAESEGKLKSIYFADGSRKYDLQYSMIHKGIMSLSNIEGRGAMKDKSYKVFRGNLDFKKGSRRASGVEEEYVILLDPTVKSDSIPALLCSEDDVNGQHAASAGQLDQEKLFYLMSRGMSENEAKKLIVEASFAHILDLIPSDELRQTVDEEIHRRLA